MKPRDYSQPGDPYGIAEEYTQQSATTEIVGPIRAVDLDMRGNSLTRRRGIPTQAEADAITGGLP